MMEPIETEMMLEHQKYKKKPENHPEYKNEWTKFWNRRYFELKKEGKDPEKYDFKPEWIEFWTKRMEELFNSCIEAKKAEVLDKLGFSNSLKVFQEKERPKKRRFLGHLPTVKHSYDNIDSSDSFSDQSDNCPRRRQRQISYSSRSSNRSEIYFQDNMPSHSREPSIHDVEPVSLVYVCRLLSAMEHETGSLSEKVLDLLAKALALEKVKSNTSDELLMTSENVIFFETVKEKLKGMLMLNILPYQKLAAVKKCIQSIAQLIHQTPVKEPEPIKVKTEDNGIFVVAEKIADALKAGGKEDVTPEELEVLVEMYFENQVEDQSSTSKVETPFSATNFETLSDDDLKILLGNFTDLHEDEQSHVIKFLTDMEKTEPSRVEALRSFVQVDIDDANNNKSSGNENQPNSNKNSNIRSEIIEIDDDLEDYNVNDVIASVHENLLKQQAASNLTYKQIKMKYPEGSNLSDNLLKFGKK